MHRPPPDLGDRRFQERFFHWARLHGFRRRTRRQRRYDSLFHPRYPDRQFRVMFHADRFQVCDGAFDRWANSLGAEVPLPRSREEFGLALQHLLEASASKVAAASEGLPKGIRSRRLLWDLEGFSDRRDEPRSRAILIGPHRGGGAVDTSTYRLLDGEDGGEILDESFVVSSRMPAHRLRSIRPFLEFVCHGLDLGFKPGTRVYRLTPAALALLG